MAAELSAEVPEDQAVLARLVEGSFTEIKDIAAQNLRRAINDQAVVDIITSDSLIRAVLGQVHQDALARGEPVTIKIQPYAEDHCSITVNDGWFSYGMSLPGLRAAAQAIPDEGSRVLLAKPGVLGLVLLIQRSVEGPTFTLIDRNKGKQVADPGQPIEVHFDINARPLCIAVIQQRSGRRYEKHTDPMDSKIICEVREAPDGCLIHRQTGERYTSFSLVDGHSRSDTARVFWSLVTLAEAGPPSGRESYGAPTRVMPEA